MNKILVPTDFSPTSQSALKYVADLFKQFGRNLELTLVHAYWVPDTHDTDIVSMNDRLKKRSIQQLEEEKAFFLQELADENVKINTCARLGTLNNVILRALEQDSFDLIVMAKDKGKKIKNLISSVKRAKKPCPITTVFPTI